VNSRTRWTIGILLALVIGLAVGLIIVAGDNSNDNGTTESVSTTSIARTQTQSTTSQATTTSTVPNGGTPAPGSTTTSPNGTGGL
jgi:hypothetical protein